MARQAVLAVSIPTADRRFLLRAKRQLGITSRIRLTTSPSTRVWPDIWVQHERRHGQGAPVITVTAEWRRQTAAERRKRLLHECLHLVGLRHGKMLGGLVYSTHPEKDTYSRAVYNRLVRGE